MKLTKQSISLRFRRENADLLETVRDLMEELERRKSMLDQGNKAEKVKTGVTKWKKTGN